ncbi:hypothetical protein Tco_1409146 [Tanacetum coccineum]
MLEDGRVSSKTRFSKRLHGDSSDDHTVNDVQAEHEGVLTSEINLEEVSSVNNNTISTPSPGIENFSSDQEGSVFGTVGNIVDENSARADSSKGIISQNVTLGGKPQDGDFNMVQESTKVVNTTSFANIVTSQKPQPQPKVNFRKMDVTSSTNGEYEAMIPVSSVMKVNERLSNSIFGYFIGKRIAFPVVKNYVFNAWGKFGIQKVMMNAKGFYFFKFSAKKSVDDVLENGPWIIRNVPIILNKWTPSTSLTKENHTKVLVWVKMHDVPLAAFTADGLSVIASKIESVVVVVPELEGETFCYSIELCPLTVKEPQKKAVDAKDDGYQVVKGRNKGKKQNDRNIVIKPKTTLVYKQVTRPNNQGSYIRTKEDNTKNSNLFSVLANESTSGTNGNKDGQTARSVKEGVMGQQVDSDDEDIEIVGIVESGCLMLILGNWKSKAIHVEVTFKADRKALFCTFVYASNSYDTRRQLWQSLETHKNFVQGRPWVIMGDFNAALFIKDTYYGLKDINISMHEFNDCVANIKVEDVNSTCLHFTWNQKPRRERGILKKIDRVMSNIDFNHSFPGSYAIFQPYLISDHAPAVLKVHRVTKDKPKPFTFFNFLVYKPEFMNLVNEHWGMNVVGYNMSKLVKKMQFLKKPLRKLLHSQGNLHDRVARLRHELDEVQRALDVNPLSNTLHDEEAVYLSAFTTSSLDEERFLKQKLKIEWLRVGDTNSAYFHRSIKARTSRSRIDCIMGHDNVLHEGSSVPKSFCDHYMQFLGATSQVVPLNQEGLFTRKLSYTTTINMVKGVSDDEIRSAMLSIGNDKAPGPDGYTSVFFKKAWEAVGSDVYNAGREFFLNGKLLKEVNHTIIALLPKVSTPSRVNDYRPISCCKHGLRQGDPMSPYLFTLVMEILTLLLKRKAHDEDEFTDLQSARILMEALNEFKGVSGLVPSIPKSTIFLDCKILVERVRKRIGDWKNKSLSFAERRQLVVSVLSSMHIYWASVFILPAGIIHDIEQLMCGFLWCKGEMQRGNAKVAWEDLCLPKLEGGLGSNDDRFPLMSHLSFRAISSAGFDFQEKVKDVVVNGAWLIHCIRKELMVCLFHLLFEIYGIPFENEALTLNGIIWSGPGVVADLQFTSTKWSDIMAWLLPISKHNNATSVVGRLVLAAVSYFIWQEQNNRVHGEVERKVEQLVNTIVDVVCLKLASIRFKKRVRVEKMRSTWKISDIPTDVG